MKITPRGNTRHLKHVVHSRDIQGSRESSGTSSTRRYFCRQSDYTSTCYFSSRHRYPPSHPLFLPHADCSLPYWLLFAALPRRRQPSFRYSKATFPPPHLNSMASYAFGNYSASKKMCIDSNRFAFLLQLVRKIKVMHIVIGLKWKHFRI